MTTPSGIGPDVNRGAGSLACDWTLVSCSIIVVAARFYVKGAVMRKFGLDDVLMAFALATAIGHAVVMTEAFHYGWGRHAAYLTPDNRIHATMWIFISQGFGVISPMFGRCSFCVYMYYIIGQSSRWQRWSLYGVAASQVAINVTCLIMIYTQCGVHVSALWGAETAHCLSPEVQTDYGYFQSAFNSLSDLYLTILPGFILWRLQLRLVLKLVLALLLCLSIFAFVASVVKTYEIHILNQRGDITWNFAVFVIWASLEINIVIMVASAPLIRPLFRRSARASHSRTYEMYPGPSTEVGTGQSRDFSGRQLSANGRKMDNNYKTARSKLASESEEDIVSEQSRLGVTKTYDVEVASTRTFPTGLKPEHPDYGW